MARTDQGGSILGFAIIGGVMALLLIGGAYVVRHNLDSVAEEAPAAVEESPEDEVAENSDTESEQSSQDENQDQQEDTPDFIPGASSEDDSDTTSQTDQPTVETSPSETTANSEHNLPQTGPGEVIVAGLLMSGAIGALAAYLRSRTLATSL